MTESSTVKYADLRRVGGEMETLKLPAYVACTRRRPALVEPFLAGIHPHVFYYGPDDTYPPKDFKLSPQWADLQRCLVGQFRAWNNHVEMAKLFLKTDAPVGLFMEDDAVPIVDNWSNIINACRMLLTTYDVFSLFADPMKLDGAKTPFTYETQSVFCRRRIVTVRPCWGRPIMVWGCQAYLMTRRVAEKLVRREYDGQPIDAYLPNFGSFAFLDPSPFVHDRSQGSMIDPHVGNFAQKENAKKPLTNVSRMGIL